VHPGSPHEAHHSQDLLVFDVHHLGYHMLGVAETGQGGVEPHDLPEASGGALQRSTPIEGDRRGQPLVLARARWTVPPVGPLISGWEASKRRPVRVLKM
jgi:hypothetical protein